MPARMMRRAINMLPTILMNVDTFSHAAADYFENQRDGDQYGTLLAGAWSLTHDRIATFAEAENLVRDKRWRTYVENTEDDEEPAKAKAVLLGVHVMIKGTERVTIYELIVAAAGKGIKTTNVSVDEAAAILCRYGIKISPRKYPGMLAVAPSHHELLKLIGDAPCTIDLRRQLMGLPGAKNTDGSIRFNGSKDRCVLIPLATILGDDERKPQSKEELPF